MTNAVHIIITDDVRRARYIYGTKQGWCRSPKGVIDPDGNLVRVVSRQEQLMGLMVSRVYEHTPSQILRDVARTRMTPDAEWIR